MSDICGGLRLAGFTYFHNRTCPSVRLSVTRISPKLSEMDVWLLGNSNRNPGFPIQNLPSDSQSEVRFHHFGCFRVAFSDKLYRKDGTTLCAVAGQLSSHPITDDTLFILQSLLLVTELALENRNLSASRGDYTVCLLLYSGQNIIHASSCSPKMGASRQTTSCT